MAAAEFAAYGLALYAAHHVGDYWIQTDEDARHKGDAGADGVLHCLLHVISYVGVQLLFVAALVLVLDVSMSVWRLLMAMVISGATHYMADRREHGLMFWLARKIPGKANFMKLGVPRGHEIEDVPAGVKVPLDNPQLATGAWALDQSWHIFWGVFVAALVLAA